MKINVDFNSLAELLNFSKTLANGLVSPEVTPKRDKNLPIGASSWQQAYETTFFNLERAYERIREFNELKSSNKVIRAEIEKIENRERAKADAEYEALKNDHIKNLCFSNRIHNCLVGAGVITISQLLKKNESDLIKLPNFGKLCLKELKETLEANNLSLKGKK